MQNQFFPAADRPELLVDMTLLQSSSIAETKVEMDRLEKTLAGDPDIVRWSSYVGQGAVRFYLPLDEQLANPFFGQVVIVTRDFDARQRVAARLKKLVRDEFVGIDGFVQPLDLGPPVGRPIQYRLSGPDIQTVRGLALKFADVIGANPHVGGIVYDWNEPSMALRIDVDQDHARQLGVSSQDIATMLNNVVGGSAITQVYDSIYIINVVARADRAERVSIETFQTLQLAGRDGQPVPLPAIATVQYQIEQPIVWRRNRLPTITLQAAMVGDLQPATVVQQLKPAVEKFVAQLPTDYSIAVGGTVEESGKGERPIADVVPLMLFLMATVLMLQLQSFQKLFLVVSVAPLGLIGVVAALLRHRPAAGLRRHPGRAGADRHHHPQHGDPGDPDRRLPRRRARALERRGRGHHAPHAAHPAHGRGRQPRHDPDRARGLLGADGLRHDRRHRRRDAADAALPAGALRRLVPHQGAGLELGFQE